ncbi:pyridoxal-phosphate dependent enzyme [Actinophytocola sp. KF-1]
MLYRSVTDMIGHTPLVRLDVAASDGTSVYAKLELANPFGMKDRVAQRVIEQARRIGALRPGAPVVESSSGTLALGLALVGRSLGHPVHIVTDPRIDPITLAKLTALGTEVHVVASMTSHGWQSARLERLRELLATLPGAFWPRQYTNPDNPGAYRPIAEQLVRDLGGVEVLVGSVGSGGSMCGTTRALRKLVPRLHAVGVDCVGSALFDQPDDPRRLQSGLGNSLSPHNLDRGVLDEVHWLNDHEAFAAARALAGEQQIFAGNTSGSVYRVLSDLAVRAEPGSRIVGIFPDRGDRYAETVYSDGYWIRHGVADMPLATEPTVVEYGTPVDRWSLARMPRPDDTGHLVFVEANTSGTGITALRAAGRLGLRPVLLTAAPGRYRGLAESLADTGGEVLECDTNSLVELRVTIQERFARQSIAGITTTSDFYARTVAELADWLDLPGNVVEAVVTCRDKAATRRALRTAGVPQPRFAAVAEPRGLAAAIARIGLPCVVKPVDDSGSNQVRLCVRPDEVHRAAGEIFMAGTNVRGQAMAGVVLVEEYLDGPEFSVETVVVDGAVVWSGVTAKSVTAGPWFVETGHLYPAPLPAATRRELVAVAEAALRAVRWHAGPAHTELRLTADGPKVVEINARLAGGMIPELVRLASGVDLVTQQLLIALGRPVRIEPSHDGHAGIRFLLAGRAGELSSVDGVDAVRRRPGVVDVAVTAGANAAVRPPRNAYDRLGHVIAAGDGTDEVVRELDAAVDAIRLRVAGAGTKVGSR